MLFAQLLSPTRLENRPVESILLSRPTFTQQDCSVFSPHGTQAKRPAFEDWQALNHSGKRRVLLWLVFSANSLALVISVYYYIAGPVELRWIFAVWGVTSSILLYFIVQTYRDIKRRQMINRWILK